MKRGDEIMSAMLAYPPHFLYSAMPSLHTNHQVPHFPTKLAFFTIWQMRFTPPLHFRIHSTL